MWSAPTDEQAGNSLVPRARGARARAAHVRMLDLSVLAIGRMTMPRRGGLKLSRDVECTCIRLDRELRILATQSDSRLRTPRLGVLIAGRPESCRAIPLEGRAQVTRDPGPDVRGVGADAARGAPVHGAT